MQAHCLPMTVHCGNLQYDAQVGAGRKRVMLSMMQSSPAMSLYFFEKP